MNFAPFAFQNNVVSAAPPSGPTIITSGLWLYAATYDNASYPGTGTTYNDLSGNGYNGTLVNGVAYNGTDPKYLETDGVNDYVSFGDTSSGLTSSDYSWGMWINLATVGANIAYWQRGVDIPGQSGGWSLMLVTITNKWQAQVVTTSPSTVQTNCLGTSTVSTNTWYNVCGVWDNGVSLKVYVNGVLENTTNTTRTTLRQASAGWRGWSFGRAGGSTYAASKQSMNYVYNRVLSDAEVLANFNTTKQYYGY